MKRKVFIALKRICNLMVVRHGNNRREQIKVTEKVIAKIVCRISQLGSCKLKHLSCSVTDKCSHSWAMGDRDSNLG